MASLKSVLTPLNYKGGQPCRSGVSTLALDWVQVHVKIPIKKDFLADGTPTHSVEGFILPDSKNYRVEDLKRTSYHYKKVLSIYFSHKGEKIEVAQLQCLPHVSFIPWDSAVLKLNNRVLYHENYLFTLRQLLQEFNLSFVNYSRLDFASDFNTFSHSLCPVDFISRIAMGSYIFKGRKNQRFIASDGYELHRQGKDFNALRLGSRSSELTVQLYNKSKELLKKASKPWIKEFWKANGLSDSTDVWRLEFSMKKSDKALVDQSTGEVLADWKDINLLSKDNIQRIYSMLLRDHFAVAEPSGSQKQFCRMKPVVLFDALPRPSLLVRINLAAISTTYVKYRIKKLLNSALDYKEHFLPRAHALLDHVRDILSQHALDEWFLKKYGSIGIFYQTV